MIKVNNSDHVIISTNPPFCWVLVYCPAGSPVKHIIFSTCSKLSGLDVRFWSHYNAPKNRLVSKNYNQKIKLSFRSILIFPQNWGEVTFDALILRFPFSKILEDVTNRYIRHSAHFWAYPPYAFYIAYFDHTGVLLVMWYILPLNV